MPVFQIRPLVEDDIPAVARVHVDGWRTAYAGFMNPKILADLTIEKTAAQLTSWIIESPDPLFGFVSVDGEKVIGFCLAGPNTGEPLDYDGEVYKLFVDTEYQGKGLGLKLLQAAVKEMERRGFKRVELWSFRKSASVGLYQKLGGKVVYELLETIGEDQLEVLIFGWEIGELLELIQSHL